MKLISRLLDAGKSRNEKSRSHITHDDQLSGRECPLSCCWISESFIGSQISCIFLFPAKAVIVVLSFSSGSPICCFFSCHPPSTASYIRLTNHQHLFLPMLTNPAVIAYCSQKHLEEDDEALSDRRRMQVGSCWQLELNPRMARVV